jgi:steroid delta-isomerase-like uncharacterized protein
MSAEELARGYVEEFWNQDRQAFLEEAFAPDAEYHDPMLPGLPGGPEGPRQRKATYLSALSDEQVVIEDLVADARAAAVRWTFTGRFTGEFMGRAPTGEQVRVTGIHFFRVRDGKIAGVWVEYDSAHFLNDIGVIDLGA